jgi:hypothetical protein
VGAARPARNARTSALRVFHFRVASLRLDLSEGHPQ